MPENDLNQPFDDFFYDKFKAAERNSTTKNKSIISLNQEIPNEVNKPTTLPTQPPAKNLASVSSRTKTKPISSLKCNLTNGNSKSKSTISSNSSKSSSGKGNVSRKSWTTSTHSESVSNKRQTSSSNQKLPETTKKIVCLNDSDDCDNSVEDDYSVEDDDDFVEGNSLAFTAIESHNNTPFSEPDGSLISTSESEDGYKDYAVRLITEKSPSPALIATKSINTINQPKESDSFLVPSLFPNVPSYLSFSSNLAKGPDVPHEVFKVLKFRVTSVMPKVVRIILTNSGMRLLKSEFSSLFFVLFLMF